MTTSLADTRSDMIRSNRGSYEKLLSRWARLGEAAENDEQLNAWVAHLDHALLFGSDNAALAAYGELCILHARLGWGWPVLPAGAGPEPLYHRPEDDDPRSVFELASAAIGPLQDYFPEGV